MCNFPVQSNWCKLGQLTCFQRKFGITFFCVRTAGHAYGYTTSLNLFIICLKICYQICIILAYINNLSINLSITVTIFFDYKNNIVNNFFVCFFFPILVIHRSYIEYILLFMCLPSIFLWSIFAEVIWQKMHATLLTYNYACYCNIQESKWSVL